MVKINSKGPKIFTPGYPPTSTIRLSRRSVEKGVGDFFANSPCSFLASINPRPSGISDILKVLPPEDQAFVLKADQFADRIFNGVMRKSGKPFIEHLRGVARIICFLFGIQRDRELLAAGGLHDTVEHVEEKEGENEAQKILSRIQEEFGEGVRNLVEGETKLSKKVEEREKGSLIKSLEFMEKDIRVAILKIADVSNNMEDQHVFGREKQIEHALEALEIYSSWAEILGIWEAKTRLEDRGWLYLNTDIYQEHREIYQQGLREARKKVNQFVESLKEMLRESGINFQIKLRTRRLSELYAPLKRKALIENQSLLEVLPENRQIIFERLRGNPLYFYYVSIITQNAEDSYKILNILGQKKIIQSWNIQDYIAVPRPSSYQALHLRALVPKAGIILITISTPKMALRNRLGIVSLYHEAEDKSVWYKGEYPWLSSLVWAARETGMREEEIRVAIMSSASPIRVYTPKMLPIEAKIGWTLLDVAYEIQRQTGLGIGTHAVKVWINGEEADLGYQLSEKNRDAVIEFVTSKGVFPKPAWLSIAWSPEAREEIKNYLRKLLPKIQIRLGKEGIDAYSRNYHADWEAVKDVSFMPEFLLFLAEKYKLENFKTTDDLLLLMGKGDLDPNLVGDEFNRYHSNVLRERIAGGKFRPFLIQLKIDRDRPGFINELTEELKKLKINIDQMSYSRDLDSIPSPARCSLILQIFSSIQRVQIRNIISEFLRREEIKRGYGGKISSECLFERGEKVNLKDHVLDFRKG